MPAALPPSSGKAALKFGKWLIRQGSTALGVYLAYFDYQEDKPEDSPIEWRRLQVKFTRATPVGTVEDAAVCTFDLHNITEGASDATWTDADFVAAEARFNTFFASLQVILSPKVSVSEYRWYRMAFAPEGSVYPSGKPRYFLDSGPPRRIVAKNIVGTGNATIGIPYQVAVSVTEKTPLPKHWGRFYLPNPSADVFSPFGRISNCVTWANAANVLYGGLADDESYPVVPVGAHRTLLSVNKIQVDDVPDVQRSRRPRTTLVREQRP